MKWDDAIPAIISAIAGGGLGSFLTYKSKAKAQKSSDLELLLNQYRKLLEDHQKEIERLDIKVSQLYTEIHKRDLELIQLRNTLQMYESSHSNLPLPMFTKDIRGRMLAVNDRFEDIWLKPKGMTKGDFVGTTDEDHWGKYAKQYAHHDALVVTQKKPLYFTEYYAEDGVGYRGKLIKYPRSIGGHVIGVAAIIIEFVECPIEEVHNRKTGPDPDPTATP